MAGAPRASIEIGFEFFVSEVALVARGVTAMIVGSGALLGVWFGMGMTAALTAGAKLKLRVGASETFVPDRGSTHAKRPNRPISKLPIRVCERWEVTDSVLPRLPLPEPKRCLLSDPDLERDMQKRIGYVPTSKMSHDGTWREACPS